MLLKDLNAAIEKFACDKAPNECRRNSRKSKENMLENSRRIVAISEGLVENEAVKTCQNIADARTRGSRLCDGWIESRVLL